MKRKGILIAETSTEFCEQLSNYLANDYNLCICHDGLRTKDQLDVFRPDLLVMDLALPGLDGISLLKYVTQQPHHPRILLTTCCMSPYVEATVAHYGVDLVMRKPCHIDAMAERICDLVQEEERVPHQPLYTECSVSAGLMNLNISPKRKGFDYLERSIELYCQNPCQSVTKSLYPQVAKIYETNPVAVERAIRQVIHESWDRRNETVWRRYFQMDRSGIIPRPTNAEFISRMAEWQKLQEQQALSLRLG